MRGIYRERGEMGRGRLNTHQVEVIKRDLEVSGTRSESKIGNISKILNPKE